MINKIVETIDHVICEINNETNMIDEIIHKASEMDNDKLHLINNKLNEIITQARKKLKISPKNKTEDNNNLPKNKTENNNIPKDKYIYEDIKENRCVRTFFYINVSVV